MVDEKPIDIQIHEFKEHLKGAEKNGTTFSEDFKVSCLIDKMPPSWSDFAKSLRHKQGILTLTQEIKSIRVEEKHRDNLSKPSGRPPRVNLVENNRNKNNSNFNRNNHHQRSEKFKGNNFKPRNENFKLNRFNQNKN